MSNNNTQLVAVSDMQTMAGALAKSGLFGLKTADQALALMIVAQAEGRHPGSVASDYHIIQGRASLKSDAMLARFQQAGGRVEWHEHSNEQVSATFSHPQGGSLRIDWDLPRAKAAGLGSKDNWKAYPRQMLRARVISEGVRAVFPAVLNGMYTPEEVQEFRPVYEGRVEEVNQELAALPAPVELEVHEELPTHDQNDPMAMFAKAFEGREAEVEAFLRTRDQLKVGQSWHDARGYLLKQVAKRLPAFLKAVESFTRVNKEASGVA